MGTGCCDSVAGIGDGVQRWRFGCSTAGIRYNHHHTNNHGSGGYRVRGTAGDRDAIGDNNGRRAVDEHYRHGRFLAGASDAGVHGDLAIGDVSGVAVFHSLAFASCAGTR